MEHKTLRLGETLCEAGLIDHSQLLQALEDQKNNPCKLGELLVKNGWINHQQLTETLAKIFQIPFVRLSETVFDEQVIGLIPYEILQTYKVIPIAIEDNHLMLATNNPLDVSALQDIQYKSGYLINPVMAGLQEIDEHLQEYADSLHNVQSIKTGNSQSAPSSSVVQWVDSTIRRAIKERASDIHFEPQRDKMRVRFRIDGILYERASMEKELERNVISRIKIIGNMDVAENRRPQDGRMSFSTGKAEYDIRISTLPNILGENLVLRILNKHYMQRSFSELGMEGYEISIMNRLLKKPYGLILATGPTGAGKTTTLYSALNQLNQTSRNIISVEDPVEYELKGINQTPINKSIGYTFANSVRHILRHDPDIIMIGEIRDVETAEIAIRAALTGHLVLSTIHANTASGAITRLLEMGIEPFLVSYALNGALAQRLVRQICPNCHEEHIPQEEALESITRLVPHNNGEEITIAKAVGCEQCAHTGYKGRIGLFEILEMTEPIRMMVLKQADERGIMTEAMKHGMATLKMSGFQKVLKKVTTIEEVMGMIY